MLQFIDIAGMQVLCTVPATTIEVLEWRVRIRCIESPVERVNAGARWLSDRTEIRPEDAAAEIGRTEIPERISAVQILHALELVATPEVPAHVLLYAACEDLCEAAGVPEKVLDGIVAMRDRQSGIDPDWSPKSPCECLRCQWPGDPDDAPANPLGMSCIYEMVDSRAVSVSTAVWGLGDAFEPYWMTQIRGALQQADGRRLAWSREEREERDEWSEANDELAAMLGVPRG